jgi:SAM-dependent methyltransferase
VSEYFGFERGTPVDRYYLHQFLNAHRGVITGKVLEIQVSGYTRRYGHAVSLAHTVDIDPSISPTPTFVVDLARAEGVIPDDTYDCFLLPNTLSVIRDIEGALRNALRVVKPGGVVIATAAGFVQLTGRDDDYWRMSAAGWREVTNRVWPGCEVTVEQHGNCLTAVGAMLGLTMEEFSPDELQAHHDKFSVAITLFCRKTSGACPTE